MRSPNVERNVEKVLKFKHTNYLFLGGLVVRGAASQPALSRIARPRSNLGKDISVQFCH